MFPKDLVVFLEPHPACRQRLAFAALLAERWQAHLIVTFVAVGRPRISEFVLGGATRTVLDRVDVPVLLSR